MALFDDHIKRYEAGFRQADVGILDAGKKTMDEIRALFDGMFEGETKLYRVHEQRVAERTAEVEQNREFLSAVLENTQDAILVMKDARFVFMNRACLEMLGAKRLVRSWA